MLYNLLNTTKTARFFAIYGMGVLQLLLCRYGILSLEISPTTLLETLLMSFLLLVNLSTINLLVRKNQLSEGNLLVPFLWILLIFFFPKIYQDSTVMMANTCILLLSSFIIYLRNNTDGREIFFNSSVLIFVGSYFFLPSLLWLLLLWAHILIYPSKRLRNMLIPVVTFALLGILSLAIALPMGKVAALVERYYFIPDFSYEAFVHPSYLPLYTIIILNLTLTSWIFWGSYKRYISRLFVGVVLVGLLGIILFPNKNAVGMVYLTFPTALSLMVLIERIRRVWLKELLLWLLLIASFGIILSTSR